MPLNARVAAIVANHPEQEQLLAALLDAKGSGIDDLPEDLAAAKIAVISELRPVIEQELRDDIIEDVVLDGFELLCELDLL